MTNPSMYMRLCAAREAMESSLHTTWALDEHDVVLALIELFERQDEFEVLIAGEVETLRDLVAQARRAARFA